jgi:hypothetical protein
MQWIMHISYQSKTCCKNNNEKIIKSKIALFKHYNKKTIYGNLFNNAFHLSL